ncbi:DNA cytosine methyltransferase [Anaerocolumna sp. MB42-C2]|uniref:DNA cytosine methyltransferase n=1 Tax=Anaerocolumna sp. MB42-C2 TaxID=3070997 RepID=UPI0027DFCA46|nr:DNA cytosine methyltransferase [Anaerocolumna sp. MB42-C2]WMJ86750.1 DNA cytosine methyltransferase [Anaerocolumna sp. MB42-C2]
MNSQLTLGSLFSGSGGFELGGLLNGIKPVWNSEIEPFPIRVTTKRFPWVCHLSDISAIDGSKIEPVNIITFGSPCTDMSIAGKRTGLDGKQSVLFYEAIRIINEMRCATDGNYPRFILWENVPGAFSSNKGEDFKAVLNAIIQIAEPDAEVPSPSKNGWPYADIYVGNGWSLAYRTVDAQYFGVAQRRKRIYLVADFGSERAGEILFESQGLSRNFTPCFGTGQTAATGSEGSLGEPVCVLNDQGGSYITVTEGMTATLRAEEHGHQPIVFEPGASSRVGGHVDDNMAGTLRACMGDNQLAVVVENHPADSRVKLNRSGKVQSLTSRMGTGGNNVPLTLKIRSGCEGGGKGALLQEDKSATLSTVNDQSVFVPKPMSIAGNIIDRSEKSGGNGLGVNEDISFTLNTADRHAVVYSMPDVPFHTTFSKNIASTLLNRDYKSAPLVSYGIDRAVVKPEKSKYIVRRLTPIECARLQGFPDWWCEGLETSDPTEEEIGWWSEVFETHRHICCTSTKAKTRKQIIKWLQNPRSDSAEYKMWGNGVALPCVCFVMRGVVEAAQRGM